MKVSSNFAGRSGPRLSTLVPRLLPHDRRSNPRSPQVRPLSRVQPRHRFLRHRARSHHRSRHQRSGGPVRHRHQRSQHPRPDPGGRCRRPRRPARRRQSGHPDRNSESARRGRRRCRQRRRPEQDPRRALHHRGRQRQGRRGQVDRGREPRRGARPNRRARRAVRLRHVRPQRLDHVWQPRVRRGRPRTNASSPTRRTG